MGENRKPCKECPFRKDDGAVLGGSSPERYIGQALGPFFLPCHMDPDYERNRRSTKLLQCAGAATFRANVGVSDIMPDGLLKMPPDKEGVFASPVELYAHHKAMSIDVAEMILRRKTPRSMLMDELIDVGVRPAPIRKKGE